MKNYNSTFLYVLAIIISLSFASCGGDDEPGSGNVDCNNSVSVNSAVEKEAQAVSDAASAWGMDPSAANCTTLQTAYQDYLDALNSLLDCANEAGILEEFNALITLTEASFELLTC